MYPSDLTEAQWAVLEPVLLAALAEERRGRHGGGRPRKYPVRRVLEAILYVARTGCQWRAPPINFPPWLSCHQQFRAWRESGLWERIKGRKRHIAVDRDGRLLAAVVHSAGVQDSAGARLLLPLLAARQPSLRTVYADGGYQGKLLDWATGTLGISLSILKRTLPKGFQILPKRWVVERTLAWLGWNRRLSKDYELNPHSAECFLFLAAAMSSSEEFGSS